MSRLDYITIGIVAACILAIIFLVYKMTDLFNENPVSDPIEDTTTKVEVEGDDVYNYEIDKEGGADNTGEATTDDETTTDAAGDDDTSNKPSTIPPSTDNGVDKGERPVTTPSTFDNTTRRTSSGKYLVIAGTFSQKNNAKKLASQLKKLGFSNASVENFDRGKYAVVLVDRFDNMAGAERLVKDLKAENINSYVKVKEAN